MTAQVTLEHLLTRLARAFDIQPSLLRSRHAQPKAIAARMAFCRMARFAGAGDVVIGMKIGRAPSFVDQAVWEAGLRISADRDFASRYLEVELECVAEAQLAESALYPLPRDADPRAIAARLLDSPREAMSVGVGDLAALGAAFLALSDELEQLRAERAEPLAPALKDVSNGQVA